MNTLKSPLGFVLMEPAFLRAIAEFDEPAHDEAHERVVRSWSSWVCARWRPITAALWLRARRSSPRRRADAG